MSKSEVLWIAITAFSIGLGMSLSIPNSYEVLNHIILLLIDQIIVPYFLIWVIASLAFILLFGLAFLYYEEQMATFYRVFWIWGPTGSFSWFGGIIILHNFYAGILLWFIGVVLGLSFRWAAPPLTKFLIWREV